MLWTEHCAIVLRCFWAHTSPLLKERAARLPHTLPPSDTAHKFSLYVNIWGLHLNCPSGTEPGTSVPSHPLCSQEQGNSLPQPCFMSTLTERAPKSLGFLYTQHREERKHAPISIFWSLLFHFYFTSWPTTSLMPTPSSAAPNPGSNFPSGILSKTN